MSMFGPIPTYQPSDPRTEAVVLLHGWYSSPIPMKRLEWALRREGYQVFNPAYRSIRVPLATLASEYLPGYLQRNIPKGLQRLHFVTHSMGGLLLRGSLAAHRPPNLGRVVFLGTPHHGSEAADFWSKSTFCRWLAGPNLASLQTGPAGYSATLSPADYEALVIAGDRPLSPFWSPLPAPHDGKVSVASTRLAGSARHVVVPHTHFALPFRAEIIRQVVEFLRRGDAGLHEQPTASAPWMRLAG
jgi:hypothetical protein